MTDKVQKIREGVARIQLYTQSEVLKQILDYIDKVQEEPVSEFLNTESMIESYKQRLISQANGVKNSPLVDMCLASYKHGINETLDTLSLSNVQRTVKNREEPVSKLWHDASEETPTQGSNILMIRKKEKDTNYPPIAGCFHGTNSRLDGRNWGYYNGFCYNEIEPPVKWAYIDDILNFFNVERTVKNWKEPVSEDLEEAADKYESEQQEKYKDRDNHDFDNYRNGFVDGLTHTYDAFKAGAEWQKTKDESTTEDLGDYIYELSKQFPEVSFANLIRIAVRVAKWQKEHLWKPADGADLQEHDNEVIAILNNGKMVFAHRPPEFWDGKNIDTGKVTRYHAETYDKGGWNIPDVKWWLDFLMPKEIEL